MNELEKSLNDYIDSLLKPEFYGLNKCPSSHIDKEDIYSKVTSSRFRKVSLTEDTVADLKKKIADAVDNKKPLQFSVPFGAYKSWKLYDNFQPDWAEVFNISYLLMYGSQIVESYPYGVVFTYSFVDELMFFVSDIPFEESDNYHKNFQKLLDIFNAVDSRVQFRLVPINELYATPRDFYIDFLEQFLDNLVFWDSKYDESTKNRHLNSSYRNLYPFGKRHINEQDDCTQQKYYYYSALMTDAVDCMKERRKFNKNSDKIQLVGVKGPSKCITIGACETCNVHFWVGQGCLKYHKGKILPYIYTYSNISSIIEENKYLYVDINSPFRDITTNCRRISFVED